MTSFLKRVAADLLKQHSDLTPVQVIVPSRRSAIFLKRALASMSDEPRWAPHITTINELVFTWSGWQKADPVSLLFWAYEAYEEVFQSDAEGFDNFVRWAPIMLSDFSELDAQLVPADDVLGYLADAKRIEHWEPQAGYTNDTVQQYLKMWAMMPAVYHKLREKLKSNKAVYQGMAYRKAAQRLPQMIPQLKEEYEQLYFTGFNVLTGAEESIFTTLYRESLAQFYWDTDAWYWLQPGHEAAAGLQKIKLVQELQQKEALHYCEKYIESHPLIINEVPASGNHAQIMAAQKILEQIPAQELQDTAVILADESLLLPFLENLTPHVTSLNVTMGLPLTAHPLAGFFNHLLQGRLEAEKHKNFTSSDTLSYYARWWEQLLSFREMHLLLGNDSLQKLNTALKIQNRAWLSPVQIQALTDVKWPDIVSNILADLCTPSAFFEKLIHLAETLRPLVNNILHSEALYHFFTLFQRLQQLLQSRAAVFNFDTAHNFYRQALRNENLDLIGEPLQGLQVMGTLESRNLDFRHVIILSLNEGVFPQSGGQDSFIPFDIKKKYGLPTFLDKDATFAYYFYRLLHRSEHLWMVYNSEIAAFQSGEASRYLLQVKKELAPALSNVQYHSYVLHSDNLQLLEQTQKRSKSPAIMERLKQKAESGFSYSALSNFLKNPLQFYYQDLINLQEAEQWEPTITPRELGTTVHNVLEDLYQPHLGKRLSAKEPFLSLSAKEVEDLLREKYRQLSGERIFEEGHDMLKMEQMVIMVRQFLQNEKALLENSSNSLVINGLEKEYRSQITLPKGLKVTLKGLADRVDTLNGVTRIIDYKTGSAPAYDYKLAYIEQYRKPQKIKALQLLIYGYLYLCNHPEALEVEAAVVSLQKNSEAYVPLLINKKNTLKRQQLPQIEEELSIILQELFDSETPFTEQAPLDDEDQF